MPTYWCTDFSTTYWIVAIHKFQKRKAYYTFVYCYQNITKDIEMVQVPAQRLLNLLQDSSMNFSKHTNTTEFYWIIVFNLTVYNESLKRIDGKVIFRTTSACTFENKTLLVCARHGVSHKSKYKYIWKLVAKKKKIMPSYWCTDFSTYWIVAIQKLQKCKTYSTFAYCYQNITRDIYLYFKSATDWQSLMVALTNINCYFFSQSTVSHITSIVSSVWS